MAAGKIGVTEGTNKDLQTFVNNLGDGDVHAEAVALVDTAGAAITTLPVSGPLTDAQLRASNVNVDGTFWQATQPISGTVNVGNFPATQPVSGTVNIGNFPATQQISGSVNIGNFPAVQAASQSGTWYVQAINSTSTVNSPNASNFLATITGTVGVNAITNPVTVSQSNASNFLATVSGTVTAVQSNASNFLSTISGTVTAISANASNMLVTATQSGTNWTTDLQKLKGTTIDVDSGNKSAGTQRVVLATDQPALANKLLVTPDSNIAMDLARIQGQASVASVAGVLDVMPRKRTASTGLSPSYISGRISSSTTTTIVASTCYLSSLHMTCVNTGAAWALKVQNGEATAKVLIPNFVLNVNYSPGGGLAFANPIQLAYDEPIICTSGINVVTVGGSAGNIDYFATYWQ